MRTSFLFLSIAITLAACTSTDRYNDVRHANAALRDTVARHRMLNKQLQNYIDDHINMYHAGEHITLPQDQVVKDTEIRSLRMQINKLKLELEYKNHLIENIKQGSAADELPTPPPSGDVPDEPPTDNKIINVPPRFLDTIGRGRLKK